MTAATVNGNGQAPTAERARQVWQPGMTGNELARRLDIPERTGRYHAGRLAAEPGKAGKAPAAAPIRREPRQPGAPRQARPARARQPRPAAGADERLETWARRAAAWGLSAVALLMSYSHTKGLVITAGVSWPALMPLTVDLLMVTGWLSLRRHPRDLLARLAVVTGVAGSLALNAIAARPELVATDDVRLWTYLAVPTAAVLSVHLALKR